MDINFFLFFLFSATELTSTLTVSLLFPRRNSEPSQSHDLLCSQQTPTLPLYYIFPVFNMPYPGPLSFANQPVEDRIRLHRAYVLD